jgi:hypothetical protein
MRNSLTDHWAEMVGPEAGQVNESVEIGLPSAGQPMINRLSDNVDPCQTLFQRTAPVHSEERAISL